MTLKHFNVLGDIFRIEQVITNYLNNAIKNIDGVIDALQFTIPNKSKIKQFYSGKLLTNKDLHTRLCYVVANKKNYKTIKNEIVTMPDYFDGYKTKVKFVSLQKLNKLRNFRHAGKVITQDNSLSFSINAKSNPEFTARTMIAYAKCFKVLLNSAKYGAHTIFDLPISYILQKDKYTYI